MRNGLFGYMYQIMKETEVVVNRGKSVAIKKPHVLKILFFVILFF